MCCVDAGKVNPQAQTFNLYDQVSVTTSKRRRKTDCNLEVAPLGLLQEQRQGRPEGLTPPVLQCAAQEEDSNTSTSTLDPQMVSGDMSSSGRLSWPAAQPASFESAPAAATLPPFLGGHSIRNSRQYQEDRSCFTLANGVCSMGVYDGHAGSHTAVYLEKHLLGSVAQRLQRGTGAEEAMRHSYHETNQLLRHLNYKCGSTGVWLGLPGAARHAGPHLTATC